MTNKELADHLNAKVGLTGKDAITPNIIRQWVAWDALSKAQARGRSIGEAPTWSRSDDTLKRAVRLAQLRKMGIRRKNAVIAQTYFEWGHPDFNLVRSAILEEFIKWREQLNRHQTTLFGADKFENVSAAKKRAIINQLGPLDQRFVGTPAEQSPELYAIFANAARTGESDASQIEALLASSIGKMAPEFGNLVSKSVISAMAFAIGGLTGSQEEISNSGDVTIQSASEEQFQKARGIALQFVNAPTSPDAQIAMSQISEQFRQTMELQIQLHPQISVGPWLIFLFAQTLQMVVNVPNWERDFHGNPTIS